MSAKDAIMIARKYNLEAEIRQELASGLTPEQALEEWDIVQIQIDLLHLKLLITLINVVEKEFIVVVMKIVKILQLHKKILFVWGCMI